MLGGIGDPVPPAHWRAVGVGEARVVPVREERLHGLGVALHELVECHLVSLDKLVYIVCGPHPAITSTVDTLSFPQGRPAIILRYSPGCVEGLFCELRRHGVLRSSGLPQTLLP